MGDMLLGHSLLSHCAACSWALGITVPGFITEMMASSSRVKDDEENSETQQ